jgi:hypothetical protein
MIDSSQISHQAEDARLQETSRKVTTVAKSREWGRQWCSKSLIGRDSQTFFRHPLGNCEADTFHVLSSPSCHHLVYATTWLNEPHVLLTYGIRLTL